MKHFCFDYTYAVIKGSVNPFLKSAGCVAITDFASFGNPASSVKYSQKTSSPEKASIADRTSILPQSPVSPQANGGFSAVTFEAIGGAA